MKITEHAIERMNPGLRVIAHPAAIVINDVRQPGYRAAYLEQLVDLFLIFDDRSDQRGHVIVGVAAHLLLEDRPSVRGQISFKKLEAHAAVVHSLICDLNNGDRIDRQGSSERKAEKNRSARRIALSVVENNHCSNGPASRDFPVAGRTVTHRARAIPLRTPALG